VEASTYHVVGGEVRIGGDRRSVAGMTSTRIIGLGSMGSGMARNLLQSGFALAVDDLDAARVAALVTDGAHAAAPGAVTESVVILSVPAPQHVEAICLGEDGLLARMQPGAVLVNASTVDLPTARRLDEACAAAGVLHVDGPVTGAADSAAAGTLVFMCGATDEALEAAMPQLEAMGTDIVHLGPAPAGTASKLLTNMLWFIHVSALSDSMSLAARCGVDIDRYAALVQGGNCAANSWVARHDLPNILADDDDPSFTLALCVKDLRLIGELEAEVGYASDFAAAARARFGAALERFGPETGELAVTRIAETAAQTSIRSGR
jgi:3-hydroxyisobutyrate dehydrogenase-like beta-hydroxyacid dehydrogenase